MADELTSEEEAAQSLADRLCSCGNRANECCSKCKSPHADTIISEWVPWDWAFDTRDALTGSAFSGGSSIVWTFFIYAGEGLTFLTLCFETQQNWPGTVVITIGGNTIDCDTVVSLPPGTGPDDPGAGVEVTVTFTPDPNGEFTDFPGVVAPDGRYSGYIHARRYPVDPTGSTFPTTPPSPEPPKPPLLPTQTDSYKLVDVDFQQNMPTTALCAAFPNTLYYWLAAPASPFNPNPSTDATGIKDCNSPNMDALEYLFFNFGVQNYMIFDLLPVGTPLPLGLRTYTSYNFYLDTTYHDIHMFFDGTLFQQTTPEAYFGGRFWISSNPLATPPP